MDHRFDEISKLLAGTLPRREALRRMGGLLAGAVLGLFGLGRRASAAGDPCVATCQRNCSRVGGNQVNCVARCRRYGTAAVCGCNACAPGSRCNGATCVACGLAGQACCAGNTCAAGTACVGGKCVPCGGDNKICCPGNTCSGSATFVCVSDTCQGCSAGAGCGNYSRCPGRGNCFCTTTAEGGTECCDGDALCESLPPCSKTSDCAAGSVCVVNTCCPARTVCIPRCPTGAAGLRAAAGLKAAPGAGKGKSPFRR